jgi:hypothetical protein
MGACIMPPCPIARGRRRGRWLHGLVGLRGAARQMLDGVDRAGPSRASRHERAIAHHEAARAPACGSAGRDRRPFHGRDLGARLQGCVVDRPVAAEIDQREIGFGAG